MFSDRLFLIESVLAVGLILPTLPPDLDFEVL